MVVQLNSLVEQLYGDNFWYDNFRMDEKVNKLFLREIILAKYRDNSAKDIE